MKKTNECREILKGIDYAEAEGNQVFSQLRSVSIDYTFALLGFKNHDLYFGHLGGGGGEPTGRFAELVESEYPGGVEMWKQAVRKAASSARGWVMVGYDLNDGSVFNYIMDTQNLWAVYNMVPVLALDVYEHAYVGDFGATPDGQGVRRGLLPQPRLGTREPPAHPGRGGAPGRAAEWPAGAGDGPGLIAGRPAAPDGADRGRGGASVAVQGATARPWPPGAWPSRAGRRGDTTPCDRGRTVLASSRASDGASRPTGGSRARDVRRCTRPVASRSIRAGFDRGDVSAPQGAPHRLGCARKKAQLAAVASGPSGSVKGSHAQPPDHACPIPRTTQCSMRGAPARSA